MYVIWFKVENVNHWIEVFDIVTANLMRDILKAQGYELSNTFHDGRKTSVVQQETNNGKF